MDKYTFEDLNLKAAVEEIIGTEQLEAHKAHADKLMFYIDALMERRKAKHLYTVKKIIDVLLASAYLYRLYYKENKISTLFLLREKTGAIFDAHNIDKDTQDKIFQMCECHKGEDALADFLMPQKGYPDDLFADAIFFMEMVGAPYEN